ncbi:MAG: type II secretion system minor pseudopilin GspK [Cellvibrionales bacterium]|nr:type II secretion system minor pseudopilin GspK [Cellvibrionales bacterium]
MMTSRSRQYGVALVAALILMASIVFILGNIFYRHQISVAQSTLIMHQNQAYFLALSAESWAKQLLDEDADESAFDHNNELWSQAIPAMPVDGGLINGCISDMQSRFNLNSLVKYTNATQLTSVINSENNSHATVWNNILRLKEIPPDQSRLETIIDWIDKDSSTIGTSGAEQEIYESMRPPRMIADSQIVQPSELAEVMGYNLIEVQQLIPLITALPVALKTKPNQIEPYAININTAADELLLAMGGDFDMIFKDVVINNRPFEQIKDFYDKLAFELGYLEDNIKQRWPEDLIAIATQFFELYLEVTLGEARIEVRSIIMRRFNADSVILSRSMTTVPASIDKNSASALLGKMLGKESDDEAENNFDEEQVVPACITIGA